MFWPAIEFTNRLQREAINMEWTFVPGEFYGLPRRLFPPGAEDGTWISAYSRVSGTFVTRLSMEDFPMDMQNASIRIESPLLDENYIIYRNVEPASTLLIPSNMEIIGWRIVGRNAITLSNYYPSFEQTYSQLRVYIEVARMSAYYLNRLVANVALLTFMAFFSSTLRPDVPERTIASLTVFMAIVTWMFIIIEDSPRVGYLTRLDSFMNLSFAVVFAMSVAHAVNYILSGMQAAKEKRQKRESMLKLHQTLERLAARGDPTAQRMLSARKLVSPKARRYVNPTASTPRDSARPLQLRLPSRGGSGAPPFAPSSNPSPANAWLPHRRSGSVQYDHDANGTARTATHPNMPVAATNTEPGVGFEPNRRHVSNGSRASTGVPGPTDTHADRRLALLQSTSQDGTAPANSAPPAIAAPVTVEATAGATPVTIALPQDSPIEENPDTIAQLVGMVTPGASEEEDVPVTPSGPRCCGAICSESRRFVALATVAWAKTSTTRKIDVLITVGSAIIYIGGILIIFLRPLSINNDG